MTAVFSALAALMGIAGSVWACDVPVYRYALEAWRPEIYHLVVLHRGEIKGGEKRLLGRLLQASAEQTGTVNLSVSTADVDRPLAPPAADLWQQDGSAPLPRMILIYPRADGRSRAVWSGPFDGANVERLLDSPARREMFRHLTGGQSGVWILVESGKPEEDNAAARQLEELLAAVPQHLTSPALSQPDRWGTRDTSALRIEFSLLRISRADPAEAVLTAMLLQSEPELQSEYVEMPTAFPVFGRGRMLFAVVGDGFSLDTVLMACRVIVGPCSCEIKEMNPGIDLLISGDWDEAIDGSLTSSAALPSSDGTHRAENSLALPDDRAQQASAGALVRNTLLTVGLLLVIVIGLVIYIRTRVTRT
jgi:hypothetical protein